MPLVDGSSETVPPQVQSCQEADSQGSHFWLIDSGASNSVIAERFLDQYKIVKEESVSHLGQFVIPNGQTIRMKRAVVIEANFWVNNGHLVRCHIHCVVAQIQHNVLSSGQLLRCGWKPDSIDSKFSFYHESGKQRLCVEIWCNCPWLNHEFSTEEFKHLFVNPHSREVEGSSSSKDTHAFHMTLQSSAFAFGVKRKVDEDPDPLSPNPAPAASSSRAPGQDIDDLFAEFEEDSVPGQPQTTEDRRLKAAEFRRVHFESDVVEKPFDPGEIEPNPDLELQHDSSANHPAVKHWNRISDLEQHRMQGHFPFCPDCLICSQSKGVKQHRRRAGTMKEIVADFMFIEGLKYLVFTDAATGMLAVAPVLGDIRQTGAWVEKWCYEFNLIGKAASEYPLQVITDKEDSVGVLITKAFVGREISIKRASPQNHESVGSAEKAIRTLKEGISATRLTLRELGFDVAMTAKGLNTVLAYVAMCHNMHGCFKDSGKSPLELATGKVQSKVHSSMFGSTVLAELPDSVKGIARFSKALYLRPEFASLGHVVTMIHEGKPKTFVAKSIKHVIPLSSDDHLGPDFVVRFDSDAVQVSGTQPKAVLDEIPKNVDSIKNTPAAWIRRFGRTQGCNTCSRDSYHGRVHNRACVERYKDWLRTQIASGTPVAELEFPDDSIQDAGESKSGLIEDVPNSSDRVPDAGIIPRRMLAKGPRPAALIDPALKQSEPQVSSEPNLPVDIETNDDIIPRESHHEVGGEIDIEMAGEYIYSFHWS